MSQIEQVKIPDRYEILSREGSEDLSSIVVPVESALAEVDKVFSVMRASSRGAFLILRGNSGAGKTTFLHTINLYRENVVSQSVPGDVSVPEYLKSFDHDSNSELRIIVLEEREAAVSFTDQELESWLHSINAFIRSDIGKSCLIVWPCNSDALQVRLQTLALQIGGKSLLGRREEAVYFSGPEKSIFPEIATRTLGAMNQGASISDFGLTEEDIEKTVSLSNTIGDFLGEIRDLIIEKQLFVSSLLIKEHPKMWILVVAGNEPAADVAGLTRGNLSLVDMDRLMTSTDANIVKNLKKIPEKLGVLATVLNAKILHLPVLAATASVRAHAEERLQEKLKKEGFSFARRDPADAKKRIMDSEFGSIVALGTQKTLVRGKKIGPESKESFEKVAKIASNDDAAVNRCLGEALIDCGLIQSYSVEVPL